MNNLQENQTVKTYHSDLPIPLFNQFRHSSLVAWDIETSGLDWRRDRIATCQVSTEDSRVAVVRINRRHPKRLMHLLTDSSVKKVFHHAMFDLRFMSYHWNARPRNVACTKIASKLLDPEDKEEHRLKPLLERYLGISIDKDQQLSNWFSRKLSSEQIAYAAADVVYLIPLLGALERELKSFDLLELERACFEHIPTRVQLELLGYPDVYTY